jgi:hypothetical protein
MVTFREACRDAWTNFWYVFRVATLALLSPILSLTDFAVNALEEQFDVEGWSISALEVVLLLSLGYGYARAALQLLWVGAAAPAAQFIVEVSSMLTSSSHMLAHNDICIYLNFPCALWALGPSIQSLAISSAAVAYLCFSLVFSFMRFQTSAFLVLCLICILRALAAQTPPGT